jgi:DNA-binding response OmpR family regulator
MEKGQWGDQKRDISILCVDDQPDILQIFAFQLEYLLGATVDFASTGKIAICSAQRNQYDLIVADVHVPDMDGFELTSHLRQIGIKVPIILTSAATFRDYRVGRRGADAFLQKPFSSDELAGMVEELLRQARTHPDPSQREQLRAQTTREDGGAGWLRQWDEPIGARFRDRMTRPGD